MARSRAVTAQQRSSRRRIGLLTGTFDPVHLGHVTVARAAIAQCRLNEVWLLVNPDPTHKQGVTSYTERRSMVELTLVGQKNIKQYDQSGLNITTHKWPDLKKLLTHRPEIDFFFIVGPEIFEHLAYWTEAADMMAVAQFLVARRDGQSQAALSPGVQAEWFVSSDYVTVSSGQIRGALAVGEVPEGLDSRVLAYIQAHKLYGAQAV